MNLALKKLRILNSDTLFQTPTNVSRAAMASGNPFEYYENWLIESRQGRFLAETEDHLKKVREMMKDGYVFTII